MKDYTEKEIIDKEETRDDIDHEPDKEFEPIEEIQDESVQNDFSPIETESSKNINNFNPIDFKTSSRKSWNYYDTIEHKVVEELLKNQYQSLHGSIKSYLRWYFKTKKQGAFIDPPPNYRKYIKIFEKNIKNVKKKSNVPNEWVFTKEKNPKNKKNKENGVPNNSSRNIKGRPRGEYQHLGKNPAYKILETIRKELEEAHNILITNVALSEFLGMNKNYITKKYIDIKQGKEGYITNESYKKIKKRISSHFSNICGGISINLANAFKEYESYLSKHKYIRSEARSKIYHPNLKSNFFKIMNTSEKRYYLGFMYSDGYLIKETDKYRTYFRIGFKTKVDDEILIDRFINNLGLNPEGKHLYEDPQEHNGKLVTVHYYRILFANQQMADDLINWGVIPNKSNIIRLPKFPVKEDYHPFLMGCFDGDGEAGTTRLWSGSRKFLEDIKLKFNVPNEIRYRESNYGSAWGLSLGPKLFNKMVNSYPASLARKRKEMREW